MYWVIYKIEWEVLTEFCQSSGEEVVWLHVALELLLSTVIGANSFEDVCIGIV